MHQSQQWPTHDPSLVGGRVHEYFIPSTPNTQAFADNRPSPCSFREEPLYPTTADELAAHTHHQTPAFIGGLPSPTPTGPSSSPPGLLKVNVPPPTNGWSPISPLSPVASNGFLGCSFNTEGDAGLYPADATALPTPRPGLAPGWTNTHHFSQPYTEFGVNAPTPHPVSTSLIPIWPGYTAGAYHPDETFVSQETNLGPVSNFREAAGGFSGPFQHSHPSSESSSSGAGHSPQTTWLPSTVEPLTRRSSKASSQQSPKPLSSTGPSLRTAPRRFKRVETAPKPGDSPERQRARANHNMVEQQYRNRLHARYEALLEVLPPEGFLEEFDKQDKNKGGTRGTGGSKQRRMSKVDVLSRAHKLIRFLETDNARARRELEQLRRKRGMDVAFRREKGEGVACVLVNGVEG